jgi:hypothetical protein
MNTRFPLFGRVLVVAIGAGLASGSASALEVTAKALYHSYQSEQIVADDNYNGRQITITGVVSEIKHGPLGAPIVLLDAGAPGAAVRCKFTAASKAQVSALKPGDAASFNCTANFILGQSVHLSDCSMD